ncbi:MAG TPA: hypothetical protein PKE29_17660 [Phycisphaerales bacterium]|nr:hypothetical protein [Phycisphaerales bacterium]
MSQQATQPGATELDASIDALFNQLEPGAPAPLVSIPTEPNLPDAGPTMHDPVLAPFGASPAPAASAGATAGESDAMLAEVADEIEREGPSPAESGFSFQEPSAEELRVEAPAPAPPGAPVNIERLDAALAANADKALAAAQDDLASAEPVPLPAPSPGPRAAAAPEPVPPAPVAPPATIAHHEAEVQPELPAEPATHGPIAAAVAEPAAPKAPLSAVLLAPLRPLAALHERLGESTRQTIGYCAILTLFSAACAWGLPLFLKKPEMDPARGEQPFIYNDTTPAHGVRAPARHDGDSKGAAHGGGGGGGHGEAAKKDDHARPEKKTSSRAKKPSKAAKPDPHGGH